MQEEHFECFNVEEEIRVCLFVVHTRVKTWLDRTHPILTQSKETGWHGDRVWDLDST